MQITDLWSSNLELAGLILGVINVVLLTFSFAPRLQWWNWVAGVGNAVIYTWLFYEWELFGNFALQIPFVIINLIGLWAWRGQLRNESVADVKEIPTTWATTSHFLMVSALALVAMIVVYPILDYVDDPSPLWDGLILTISLAAAWLQFRKYVQSWFLWILVDVIAVPFHYQQKHPATALLYLVYGIICFYGLYQWWKATQTEEVDNDLVSTATS